MYTHHREVSARGLRLLVLSHCVTRRRSLAGTCFQKCQPPQGISATARIEDQSSASLCRHRCPTSTLPHCGITSLRQVSTMRLHCSSVSCPSPHAHCSPHAHTHSLTHRETRANTSRLQNRTWLFAFCKPACFPSHSEFRDPRGLLSSEATLNVNCSPLSLPVEARPLQKRHGRGMMVCGCSTAPGHPGCCGLHWICPAHSGWCSNLP